MTLLQDWSDKRVLAHFFGWTGPAYALLVGVRNGTLCSLAVSKQLGRFRFVLSPILLVEISVKLVFVLLLFLLLLGIGTLWSFLAGHVQATEYR